MSKEGDVIDLPTIVFSKKIKQSIIYGLQAATQTELAETLIEAVLSDTPLVCVFDEVLESLHLAYHCTKDTSDSILIKYSMVEYVKKNGIYKFLDFIDSNKAASSPISDLLYFMAKKLGIAIAYGPIIQAQVKDGKVHWRIIQPDFDNAKGTIIYARDKKGPKVVDLNPQQSWFMTWKKFRKFKASGKRTGTLEITTALFVSEAQKKPYNFSEADAKKIFAELQECGILNGHCRISIAWHTFSGPLKFESTTQLDKVVTILQKILKENKTPDIVINGKSFPVHREDLTSKKTKSGKVQNDNQSSKDHYPKRWDVCPYGLLYNIRANVDLGENLEFDHIPSGLILKNYSFNFLLPANAQKKYKEAQEKINDLKTPGKTGDEKIKKKIQLLEAQKCKILKSLESASIWWVIAVPKWLHTNGKTYQIKSKVQIADAETIHPFLKDIDFYLNELQQQPERYDLSEKDFPKAAGAFRYLFRCQLRLPLKIVVETVVNTSAKKKKNPVSISVSSSGQTPYAFFQSRKAENPQIDKMFNDHMLAHTDETRKFKSRK